MNYFLNFKKHILNGALAIVPLSLVYLIVRFLYVSVDSTILNLVDDLIGFRIQGLGIVIILVILYLLGLFAGNLVGRWFFSKIEWITQKIPLIRIKLKILAANSIKTVLYEIIVVLMLSTIRGYLFDAKPDISEVDFSCNYIFFLGKKIYYNPIYDLCGVKFN